MCWLPNALTRTWCRACGWHQPSWPTWAATPATRPLPRVSWASPAVIGIQRLDVLRALDGVEVTVDGTRGRVFRGLLPLHQVGGEMDVAKLPPTKTKVGLVLADVGQALFLSRLRNFPQFEVGLLRAEFMLGNIGVHPQALEAFDKGELEGVVRTKLKELENRLSKVLREQMATGLIVFNFNLREYVGEVTGLAAEVDALADADKSLSAEEVLLQHRKMRELDHKIDQHMELASRRIEVLKTSPDLADHVRIIMGYDDELALLNPADPEAAKRMAEIEAAVEAHVHRIEDLPAVTRLRDNIRHLREEVGLRTGLKKEMDDVRNLPEKIRALIKSRGFRTGKEHYVQTLAQNLALLLWPSMASPLPTVLQTSRATNTAICWAATSSSMWKTTPCWAIAAFRAIFTIGK